MEEFIKKISQCYLSFLSKSKLFIKKLYSKIQKKDTNKDEVFNKITEFLSANDEIILLEKYKIIKNFLSFNRKIADDIIIPRTDVVAVRIDISLPQLIEIINKNSLNKILVYQDTLDNVIGFLHIKEVFKVITRNESFQIEQILQKPIISTHVVNLWDLFKEMQLKKIHLAIIIDEYGGLDGIITLENITAQLFDNYGKEYLENQDDNNYKIITPSSIIANARMKIEVLENLLGIELRSADDEFDTVGGWVMTKAGKVSSKGDRINITDDLEIIVLDSNERTLKTLKITLKKLNLIN